MINYINPKTKKSKYAGLSSDTKPLNVQNGSIYFEINTGAVYMFDEESNDWYLQEENGGGGGTGGVSKVYVDTQDQKILKLAKEYADSKVELYLAQYAVNTYDDILKAYQEKKYVVVYDPEGQEGNTGLICTPVRVKGPRAKPTDFIFSCPVSGGEAAITYNVDNPTGLKGFIPINVKDAVLYTKQKDKTEVEKKQARKNIGANGLMIYSSTDARDSDTPKTITIANALQYSTVGEETNWYDDEIRKADIAKMNVGDTILIYVLVDDGSPTPVPAYIECSVLIVTEDSCRVKGIDLHMGTSFVIGEVSMTEATAVLNPNIMYVWGEVPTLTLTFAPEIAGVPNEYMFRFTSPSGGATNLNIPSDVKWAKPLNIQAGFKYEMNISDNLGVWVKFLLGV